MDPMKTLLPLVAVLLLAGCDKSGNGGDKAAEPVALVRTAVAALGNAPEQVIVYGAAEAEPSGERTITIPAEAIVDRIEAPAGTTVRVGQPILVLKPSRATATDVAKAASDAQTADAAYARAKRLRADGLVSDADVETARAAAVTARSTLTHLGMGTGGTVLRAPITGTVQGLTAKPGDQIAAGTAVASIAGAGDLRARFGIDPTLAQRVHTGQAIAVDSIASDGHADLTVAGVDQQVDTTTRLASVYARIPDGLGVGPGSPLRAEISVGGDTQGVLIPYDALLDDGGRSYVFVVSGDVAHEIDVSPGSGAGDSIRILKGLQPGDVVVTQGGTALEDGMRVRTGAMSAALP
jgi:RND family efflux transporter MFP subunit